MNRAAARPAHTQTGSLHGLFPAAAAVSGHGFTPAAGRTVLCRFRSSPTAGGTGHAVQCGHRPGWDGSLSPGVVQYGCPGSYGARLPGVRCGADSPGRRYAPPAGSDPVPPHSGHGWRMRHDNGHIRWKSPGGVPLPGSRRTDGLAPGFSVLSLHSFPSHLWSRCTFCSRSFYSLFYHTHLSRQVSGFLFCWQLWTIFPADATIKTNVPSLYHRSGGILCSHPSFFLFSRNYFPLF